MSKFSWLFCFFIVYLLFTGIGCNSSGVSPTEPSLQDTPDLTNQAINDIPAQHTALLGFYDISIDPETGEADISENRTAMFTMNIVTYLNLNNQNVKISLNSITPGPVYTDLDVDFSFTHPLPNQPTFDVFDVRGIIITVGALHMASDTNLFYGQPGTGIYVMNADGYTRWFNKPEFNASPGILSYVKGNFATNGYNGTATLNPYKYFADGLAAKDSLWNFITTTPNSGIFTSGATNTRNYLLRNPTGSAIKFAYSVLADWNGPVKPSNAPEALVCDAVVAPDLWYVNPGLSGGNLILDISVFDWSSTYVSGPMTDYNLLIESTVLSAPYQLNPAEMTPNSGAGHVWTYHVEIPADNIVAGTGNEFWVNVVYPGFNYTNAFGILNTAWASPLTACFRNDLPVSPIQPFPPVVDSGVTGQISPSPISVEQYSVVAHDPNGDPLSYLWTVTDVASDTQLITYDPGDGNGNITIDFSVLNATDGQNFTIDCIVTDNKYWVSATQLAVTTVWHGWARTWGGTGDDIGMSTTTDNFDNVYTAGNFVGTVDFDPGDEVDEHISNGGTDAFLVKLDQSGALLWALTWGGIYGDNANNVTTDSAGNVYITGAFGDTVDFDPGGGTDNHISNGGSDAYFVELDQNGNFILARTWGGISGEAGNGINVDSSNLVHVTGYFGDTVDFNPGIGIDPHVSAGGPDAFVVSYDSVGNFLWARTWGGGAFMYNTDWGTDVASDATGNIYVTGFYQNTVDFDPSAGTDNRVSAGYEDIFVTKFNWSGAYQWARTWGGPNTDWGNGIAIDSLGHVDICGLFLSSPMDFDPTAGIDQHSSVAWSDIFLTQLDTDGNYLWTQTWGGIYNDYSYDLAVDSSGNILITGDFYSPSVDFDPGAEEEILTSNGGWDAYLGKYDSTGTYIWAHNWGGTNHDYGYDVATNSAGYTFVAGFFYSTDADFNPGDGIDPHASNGGSDAFLSKFPANGEW